MRLVIFLVGSWCISLLDDCSVYSMVESDPKMGKKMQNKYIFSGNSNFMKESLRASHKSSMGEANMSTEPNVKEGESTSTNENKFPGMPIKSLSSRNKANMKGITYIPRAGIIYNASQIRKFQYESVTELDRSSQMNALPNMQEADNLPGADFTRRIHLPTQPTSKTRSMQFPTADEACGSPTICRCHTSLAICSNVPYIPKLPNQIKAAIVADSKFQTVNREIMQNLTSLNLTYLLLGNNSVQNITSDAFEDLRHLRKLEIDHERQLKPVTVRNMLHAVSKSLESFVIKELNWTSYANSTFFPGDLFAGLSNSSLTHVGIIRCNMSIFSDSWFPVDNSVRSLDLTQNFIRLGRATYAKLTNLQNLTLYMNSYKNFPDFCNDSLRLPNLKSLDIAANKLTDFYSLNRRLSCLESLETLNINKHSIRILYDRTFESLKSLKTLYVSEISQLYILQGNAFNSDTLQRIVFDDNSFQFTSTSFNPKEIFKNLPSLLSLDISRNYLQMESKFMVQMLRPLENLQDLQMFDMSIWYLPYNLTGLLPSLQTLNVSKNEIANFNGQQIFGNNPKVKILDFSQNRISIINQTTFPESLLNNLESLRLTFNPLSCTCHDVRWFYDWLRNPGNRKKIVNIDNLRCESPDYLKNKPLISLSVGEICPLSEEVKNLIIGLSVSVVLVLIVIITLYKSRWHIRHWLFIVRSHRRSGYTRLPDDESFVYHAFLVYAEEDRGFVHDVLLPKLEVQHGFKLCVHFRDFEVGKFIADNIVDNMNKSKKIIVVLSNNFAKSKWCDFELMIAQKRLITESRDLLVLILYKEVDFRYMSDKLRMLLTTMTYAKWSHDHAGESLFWDQIIKGLQENGSFGKEANKPQNYTTDLSRI